MGDVRRFVETDWYAWAGAERFENGTDPFIYKQSLNDGSVELSAIADENGIDIYLDDGDEAFGWHKEMFLIPIRAEGELRALAKRLQQYTYAPDLTYSIDHENCEEFKGFSPY